MTRVRRLFLLRHAKAEPPEWGGSDADRPLARKGRRACVAVADRLRAAGLAPDLVLCSSSRRTRETVEGIASALPPTVPVLAEDRLYLADADDLLARLRELDDGLPSVLLVGHNPGLHALAAGLLEPSARAAIPTFPTAALAILETGVHRWAELGPGATRLASFTTF